MDSSLISMVTVNDYNATDYFPDDSRPPKSPHEHMKKVSDRYQAEAYYFEVIGCCLILLANERLCNV
jgi:hypothetical protein